MTPKPLLSAVGMFGIGTIVGGALVLNRVEKATMADRPMTADVSPSVDDMIREDKDRIERVCCGYSDEIIECSVKLRDQPEKVTRCLRSTGYCIRM